VIKPNALNVSYNSFSSTCAAISLHGTSAVTAECERKALRGQMISTTAMWQISKM
jgi:hypothetical protein